MRNFLEMKMEKSTGSEMKEVPYIRVSTEDQIKESYSLEVQREYLDSFAKREALKSLEFTKMMVLMGTFSDVIILDKNN